MSNRRFANFATGFLLAAANCTSSADTAGRHSAIQDELNSRHGFLGVAIGSPLTVGPAALAYYRTLEAAGLVTVREIPQSYWDSFLGRTQGTGKPIEVRATPKLFNIAINRADLGEPDAAPAEPVTLRVKVNAAQIDHIVTDEEYQGPLATPGERHRTVLGVFSNTPTEDAAVVGGNVIRQDKVLVRFRCVIKYSEFTKAWSVVALDIGPVDTAEWFTSTVK